jgi:hypothetical protein
VHLHGRRRVQVGVVGDPVADVVAERLERRLDRFRGAGRPDDRQRRRIGRQRADPARDEHVAEVTDVVAVQVGEQQRRQAGGADAHCGGALQHPAPAVHQEHLPARAHQGGRPGPVRVRDGASGSQQRDLDHGPILASRTRAMGGFGGLAGRRGGMGVVVAASRVGFCAERVSRSLV